MLLSVCIPVYNTSKYLEECLESVLRQTEKDYEIVLIDDGSTDDCPRICDRYAENYSNIRVIHKENEGLLMARRRGFKEAKGDYFVCIDSDDFFYDSDALKKIKCMIEQKNADLLIYEYICGSDKSYYNQTNRRISLFDMPNGYVFQNENKEKLYHKLLLGKDLNAIFVKVVSRNLMDWDEDYNKWKNELVNSLGEDLLQSLPILDAAKKVVYLKEPLYFYRWNGESISRNINPEYYYSYRAIYKRTDEYLNKWGFDNDSVSQIKQKRINMILNVLLAEIRDKKKWLEVLDSVADDEFFQELWKERNVSKISTYYQLAGNLIIKKHFLTLQIVKQSVKILSGVKKRIFKRSL